MNLHNRYELQWLMCSVCGNPSTLIGDGICLACRLEAVSPGIWPAVRLRERPSARFHPEPLAEMVRSISYLIIEGSDPKYSIIKHCEQLRNWMVSYSYPKDKACQLNVKSLRIRVNNKKDRCFRSREAQLIHNLLIIQNKQCFYCGNALDTRAFAMDTLLQMHFYHAGSSGTPILFYEYQLANGNLAAVCGACNVRKGRWEVIGASLNLWWRRGNRVAHWYDRAARPAPALPPVAKAVRHPMPAWVKPYLAPRLAYFGMGVVSVCDHCGSVNDKKEVEIGWNPITRTLEFGCPECTSGLVRLGVLVKRKNAPCHLN